MKSIEEILGAGAVFILIIGTLKFLLTRLIQSYDEKFSIIEDSLKELMTSMGELRGEMKVLEYQLRNIPALTQKRPHATHSQNGVIEDDLI